MQLRNAFLALCLIALPSVAHAYVRIANCDNTPYDVTITNAGTTHVISLPPLAGSYEEEGESLMMTLQIHDPKGKQPVVKPTTPGEEYCIWGGRILLQRLNTSNTTPTGHGWR